jgi:lysozyme family protein
MTYRTNTDDYNLFIEALEFVLDKEGGLNDDPDDRGNKGGVTWKGVTPGALAAARRAGITDKSRTTDLTDKDIEDIYYQLFWRGAHCHEIPDPLCFPMFDISVNHGAGGAVHILQETLNDFFRDEHEVAVDGAWGPQTHKALMLFERLSKIVGDTEAGKYLEPLVAIASCVALYERAETYAEIVESRPVNRKYFYGWIRHRVKDLGKRLGF